MDILSLEPIFINNIDSIIKQTPTYIKYSNSNAFIFADVLYRIEFCWTEGLGKFHVELYDTEHYFGTGEYQRLWNDPKDPKSISHDQAVTLARLIHRQIMDEVKEIVKKDEM